MDHKRILFIQTAFIGDAILTLPALQQLKVMNPDSIIDILCIPASKEIFSSSKSVDNVIVLDKKGTHKSLLSTLIFAKKLKKNNYSILYSPHRSLRTSLIVSLLGVKESFGFDNSTFKSVYKNLVTYNPSAHEVQRNFDLVGFSYDKNNWEIKPEIISDESTKNRIELYLQENNINNNFIAIAPGSIWETKKYPKKYFYEIIDYLVSHNLQIVLIGGKKDEELCDSLSENNSSNVFTSTGNLSIIESVELLRHARLLISNDSAPTHMGTAADIKVLTIYCSTVSNFGFYPYNSKSKFISYDELDCKPCGIHGHKKCPINTFDCGEKLLPQKIISTMEGMLND